MDRDLERYQRELREARARKVKAAVVTGVLVGVPLVAIVAFKVADRRRRDAELSAFMAEHDGPVPKEAVDRAHAILKEARDRAEPLAEPRIGAILDAEARLEPHPELGGCRRDLSSVAPYDLMKLTSMDADKKRGEPKFLDEIRSELAYFEHQMPTLKGGRSKGDELLAKAAEAAAKAKPPPYDLAFSVDLESRAKAGGSDTFKSGMLAGTAFLYDYETRKVECAARFTAVNSVSLKLYETSTIGTAGAVDLMKNALEEVKANLVAVGPKALPEKAEETRPPKIMKKGHRRAP